MERTFNFTSQICTTKEQSERLLAFGLKKETADMKYPCIAEYYGGVLTEGISSPPMILTTEDDEVTEYDLPAWSLHRLIEILDIWYFELNFNEFNNVYDQVIAYFEERVKGGFLNKKYLEE